MPRKAETELANVALRELFFGGGRPILLEQSGQFYRWNGRVYLRADRTALLKEIRSWLALMKMKGKVSETGILHELKFLPGVHIPDHWSAPFLLPANKPDLDERDDPSSAENLIALQNVIFDLDLWMDGRDPARPHSPELFTTASLPYDYIDNPKCDRFEDALGQWLLNDEEQIEIAWRWMGLCCTWYARYKKLLLCVGPKDTGKSAFTGCLRLLVGQHNCAAMPLSGFGSQFQEAALIGKLLNISSEVKFVQEAAEERLKLLTSGGADSSLFSAQCR